ncbi:NAD(P)-dependent dehydrogenase (short-subunit alcohol dehydrogenase family) [Mesorhizobium sp. J18]|uniref:SDR family NAD(P)-dependent oxidoreductase n=1 Tax=Mesorhizobium sp. J18 TaxID=935263 RepID=UPI00119C4A20|nr:SDR family oxidoreductase [Mesorhizobium sp. J18]TWG99504.1 NAD(P)-dependent dehydrogenase (short-subunit alcohol dehydrogenase family) [Mesorhizobium sp. J18]
MSERIAVITGAADGIGWAMAQVFAEAGYRVALADLDLENAKERAAGLGYGHQALPVDVSDEQAVVALAAKVGETFGHVDALVNNAGISDSHLPTLEQDVGQFQRVMDVHLKGTFLMCREFGRLMTARQQGAIVNISSIAGLGGMPRRNGYGAAKAGIVALTRSLACEWARYGVRVNAIAPGYVATGLVRSLAEAGKIDIGKIERRVPLGRLAEPEDIALSAFFLVSPAAAYITGTVLSVDGGWHAFGDFGDASLGKERQT